jgi:hypothetical protein
MSQSTRARYTLEFKEEAVRLVKGGERPAVVAKNLGLAEQTLHNWLKASDAGGLKGEKTQTVGHVPCGGVGAVDKPPAGAPPIAGAGGRLIHGGQSLWFFGKVWSPQLNPPKGDHNDR